MKNKFNYFQNSLYILGFIEVVSVSLFLIAGFEIYNFIGFTFFNMVLYGLFLFILNKENNRLTNLQTSGQNIAPILQAVYLLFFGIILIGISYFTNIKLYSLGMSSFCLSGMNIWLASKKTKLLNEFRKLKTIDIKSSFIFLTGFFGLIPIITDFHYFILPIDLLTFIMFMIVYFIIVIFFLFNKLSKISK